MNLARTRPRLKIFSESLASLATASPGRLPLAPF
jgi:hypothetical protein